MDAGFRAIRFPRAFWLALPIAAATLSGCAWPPKPPVTTVPPPASQPTEAPQVVADERGPTDPAIGRIEDYLARMERLGDKRAHPEASLAAPPAAPETPDSRQPDRVWAPEDASDHGAARPARALPAAAPAEPPGAADKPAAGPETPPVAPRLSPPTLAGVSARAAAPEATLAPRAEPSAALNATLEARSAPASLRKFLEQLPPAEDADSFRQQLDARLLWAAAGAYESARAPLSLASAEQQDAARGLVESFIAMREAQDGDLGGAADRAAGELARFQDALRRMRGLRVETLVICKAVRGFGQYDAIDPPRFVAGAGSELVLYVEVADFVSEQRDDGFYCTRFDLTTRIISQDTGRTVLELHDPDLLDRCRTRRHDCYIPRLVRLPATLAAGRYVAKITLADKLAEHTTEARTELQIVAGRR